MAFGGRNKKYIEIILEAADKSTGVIEKFKQRLESINVAYVAIGTAAALMAYKVSKSFVNATGAAAQFDKKMSEVRTLTNANQGDFEKLTDAVRNLSVKYGQLDKTMATASYNVVSAGFAGITEQLKIMDIAAQAAIAGVTDVNTSASVITQTLNAYGKGADEAQKVSDILFETVRGGVITFEQLAGTLGKVTSTAATAGIPFEEVAAAIAIMTKKGIKAEEATTALNGLLVAIAAGSGEAKDKLESMGITLENGLGPALEALDRAGGGAINILKEMVPNVRALKAAASLGADGARDFKDQLDNTVASAGATKTAFQIMDATAAQAEARFESAKDKFTTLWGGTGLEARTKVFESLTGAIESLSEIIIENEGALTTFAGFMANVVTFIPDAVKGFKIWGDQIKYVADQLERLAGKDVTEKNNIGEMQARVDNHSKSRRQPGDMATGGADFILDPETGMISPVMPTGDGGFITGADTVKPSNMPTDAEAADQSVRASDIKRNNQRADIAATAPIDDSSLKRVDWGQAYKDEMAAHAEMEESYAFAMELMDETTEKFNAKKIAEWEAANHEMLVLDAAWASAMENIQQDLAQGFAQIGATGITTLLGLREGTFQMGRAIKSVLLGALEQVIMKLITIKLLKVALGGPLGWFFGDGGTVPMAAGGAVPGVRHAAFGYAVPDGPRGLDSVPIMAMPGEEIIKRNLSQRLDRFISMQEAAAAISPGNINPGGGGNTYISNMSIARPISYNDVVDLGINTADAIAEVSERNL